MPIDIMDAHFRSFSQAVVSPGAGGGDRDIEVLRRQHRFEKWVGRADGLFALFTQHPSFGSDPSRKWFIVRNRVDDA
jgi:hypothetical protein